jgi:hypothetical protein
MELARGLLRRSRENDTADAAKLLGLALQDAVRLELPEASIIAGWLGLDTPEPAEQP